MSPEGSYPAVLAIGCHRAYYKSELSPPTDSSLDVDGIMECRSVRARRLAGLSCLVFSRPEISNHRLCLTPASFVPSRRGKERSRTGVV